jgi:cbb3-type cytochrome oxidase maturation protein
MTILIYLVPVALLLGGLGLVAFLWALRSGQYEDLDGAPAGSCSMTMVTNYQSDSLMHQPFWFWTSDLGQTRTTRAFLEESASYLTPDLLRLRGEAGHLPDAVVE